MKKEELDYKLNMIFGELISIKEMLENQEKDKRKVKAQEQIEYGNREIEEIRYMDTQKWDIRQNKIREFNTRFEE